MSSLRLALKMSMVEALPAGTGIASSLASSRGADDLPDDLFNLLEKPVQKRKRKLSGSDELQTSSADTAGKNKRFPS